ncbi:hypothetical protein KIN20_002994 [Parelaphostrongylus tenuis]|uniref:Ig-like domain-containing protein n=1 Tax=Parelaphostrongylus tenuis TaxID=148309 RepID=A0AAD5MF00_PARTN|nr:hypothetical protein KIN20_002994 [Parelaphostrongylus tenuis]
MGPEDDVTERKMSGHEEQPYFVQHLENRTFTGDECTLKCIIMGTPIPHVEWTINEELVTEDE